MPVKITVIVETTNHFGRIEFTKEARDSNANGRFDGDTVRRESIILVDDIAAQLDLLTDKPLKR
jgi:hypothetical protein